MRLQPYSHQVTGHSCLLTTEDKGTICKVLAKNELDFYLHMDNRLRPFTPEFRGIVNVTVFDDNDGKCEFEAHFGDEYSTQSRQFGRVDFQRPPLFEAKETSQVKYRGLDPEKFDEFPGFESNEYTKDAEREKSIYSDIGRNPWVRRLQITGNHRDVQGDTLPYILLENLGAVFRKPCVLDLKIGKRIRGWLSKLTTTSSIGLRLTGLQVYRNGGFICRDKFYGRGLSCSGLKDTMKMFFSDEKRIKKDVISNIVDKIQRIRTAISNLDGHRLSGCSILILYEGEDAGCQSDDVIVADDVDPNTRTCVKTDVRIIDFARSTAIPQIGTTYNDEDDAFILGLTNLSNLLEEIINET